jgi:hypothetical protein
MDKPCPDIPDILLMDVEEAERLLGGAGLAFRVVETKAPRKELKVGRFRVIRVRPVEASDLLELTVCRI